jgi:hypothetical protein
MESHPSTMLLVVIGIAVGEAVTMGEETTMVVVAVDRTAGTTTTAMAKEAVTILVNSSSEAVAISSVKEEDAIISRVMILHVRFVAGMATLHSAVGKGPTKFFKVLLSARLMQLQDSMSRYQLVHVFGCNGSYYRELDKLTMRERYNGPEQIYGPNGKGMDIHHIGHSLYYTPMSWYFEDSSYEDGLTEGLVGVQRRVRLEIG